MSLARSIVPRTAKPEPLGHSVERHLQVDSLKVVKLSLPRSQPQGGVTERDLHNGQPYVDLLDLDV